MTKIGRTLFKPLLSHFDVFGPYVKAISHLSECRNCITSFSVVDRQVSEWLSGFPPSLHLRVAMSVFCLPHFLGKILKATLSKYYSKERKSKSAASGDGDDDMDDGVPVLTRVLDLSRPAICALGPLMTHLEVSTCHATVFSIRTMQQSIRHDTREVHS